MRDRLCAADEAATRVSKLPVHLPGATRWLRC